LYVYIVIDHAQSLENSVNFESSHLSVRLYHYTRRLFKSWTCTV